MWPLPQAKSIQHFRPACHRHVTRPTCSADMRQGLPGGCMAEHPMGLGEGAIGLISSTSSLMQRSSCLARLEAAQSKTPNIRDRRNGMKLHTVAGMLLVTVSLLAVTEAGSAQDAITAPAQKSVGAAKSQMIPSLAVINSGGASLAADKLTLSDVAANSIVFADRPVRAAGHVLTKHFIQQWGEGKDSFANNDRGLSRLSNSVIGVGHSTSTPSVSGFMFRRAFLRRSDSWGPAGFSCGKRSSWCLQRRFPQSSPLSLVEHRQSPADNS